jgi:hypothetical protein
MLEKALEEGEIASNSIGASYLVKGIILDGTNVCSVIKSDS